MRETRDLLRRRCFFVRQRAQLIRHVQNAASQYQLDAFAKKFDLRRQPRGTRRSPAFRRPFGASRRRRRSGVGRRLRRADRRNWNRNLTRTAKIDDPQAYHRLTSIPGVGKVLGLVLLYEITTSGVSRLPGGFCRTRDGACSHESAGKKKGSPGKKMATRTSSGRSPKRRVFGSAQ